MQESYRATQALVRIADGMATMTYQEDYSTSPFVTVLICMLLALAACASSSWWLRELAGARRMQPTHAISFHTLEVRQLSLRQLADEPCFELWDHTPIIETAVAPVPPPAPIREEAAQGVGWHVLLTPEPINEPAPTEAPAAVEVGPETLETVEVTHPGEAQLAPQGPVVGQVFSSSRQLQQQLQRLSQDVEAQDWSAEVLAALDALTATTDATDPAVAEILSRLRQASTESEQRSQYIASPAVQSDVRRIGYSIQRRLALWDSIHSAALRLQNVDSQISSIRRVQPASVTLERLPSKLLFDPPPAPPMADIYGDLLDSQEILQKLEEYELSRRPSLAREVAAYRVMFAASVTPETRRLEEHIEENYRNANFRLAITEELIGRMLPQPEPFGRRVNDYVTGVPVHGYSTTMTRLDARLIPDPYRFHLILEARGVVQSQTTARSAPATLYSRGDTSFIASKELIVSRQGLSQAPATAVAENNSRLLRVRTDYDEVPIIGSMVRRFAREEHDKRRGAANREVEAKVAREAGGQFDRQVTPLAQRAAQQYQDIIWERCSVLGMPPIPMELETSEKRLTARLRFASDDQLAAHTPRPRAPSDSLLSMQLHESVLNNGLQQLELDGKQMSLRDVYTSVATQLGAADTTPPEDIPDDVMVTFAPKNALQVHFNDGALRLTIALSRIEQKHNRWTNLVVRAYYRPQGDGLTAELVREQGMELIGDRINTRSQVILRGVFAKVLDGTRTMPLVPRKLLTDTRLGDLEVTQLQINDGWLGVAIGPKQAANRSEDDFAGMPRWRVTYQQESARWR